MRTLYKRPLEQSHLPSWVNGFINDIRQRRKLGDRLRCSYRSLGVQIGAKIDEWCEDFDTRFSDDEWYNLGRCYNGEYFLRSNVDSKRVLSRLFDSDRHPRGKRGLLDQIPRRHYDSFLLGIYEGVVG